MKQKVQRNNDYNTTWYRQLWGKDVSVHLMLNVKKLKVVIFSFSSSSSGLV